MEAAVGIPCAMAFFSFGLRLPCEATEAETLWTNSLTDPSAVLASTKSGSIEHDLAKLSIASGYLNRYRKTIPRL